MLDRTFTPAEANSALGEVRPAAERLVRLRERMRELESAAGELVIAIGGNGGGHAAGDLGAAQSELVGSGRRCGRVRRPAAESRRLVKDPDLGLLDFPAAPRRGPGRSSAGTSARTRVAVLARLRGGVRRPETDRLGRRGRALMSEFWQHALIAAAVIVAPG